MIFSIGYVKGMGSNGPQQVFRLPGDTVMRFPDWISFLVNSAELSWLNALKVIVTKVCHELEAV